MRPVDPECDPECVAEEGSQIAAAAAVRFNEVGELVEKVEGAQADYWLVQENGSTIAREVSEIKPTTIFDEEGTALYTKVSNEFGQTKTIPPNVAGRGAKIISRRQIVVLVNGVSEKDPQAAFAASLKTWPYDPVEVAIVDNATGQPLAAGVWTH
jgi:hypothetical protein